MAIVKLKKVTLCGLSDAKTQTLIDLQKMGVLHLIPMQTALSTESTECYQAEQVIEALKYLNQCPNKRHQMHSSDQFDLDVTTQEVLKVKSSIRSLSDQRDALKKRIEEIEPWGDFQLPDPEEVAGLKLWFYIVPKRLITEIADNLIWQCVYQNNQFAYVVVVAETEPQNSAMPVARTHTGSISLSQLRHQLNEITLALEDRQAE
ncbi:MAG: ATPase, partial [Methylicorpusculum sp.]|nr:ATPase [Methylicorpusculum sp.]